MSALAIEQIPVLGDNYVYLVHDPESGQTAAVDPALADPVKDALARRGWKLSHILNTHHHGDHTDGNLELKIATGCSIVGAAADAARIPGIDVPVGEGDIVAIGGHRARVFEVPGHTSGHIAFWFEPDGALFPGDALFSAGCGRMFEGSAGQMWESLKKMRSLPDHTMIYCAHEYTGSNIDFALGLDPDNAELKRRAGEVRELRRQGQPTVPSSLGEEKLVNPFLRADDDGLLKAAGLTGRDPVSAFAEIRLRKDNF